MYTHMIELSRFEIVTVLPQLTCNYTSNVSMHALCAHMTVHIKIIIGLYYNYGLVHTGSDHEDRRNNIVRLFCIVP